MRPKYVVPALFILLLSLIPFLPTRVLGQAGNVQSRIGEAVDNTKLATLRGNVHPLARTQFDRGAAPASLPMEHMMLLLTRSPQQEAALETLMAQQQEPTSANYHKWLTPQQFGQEFGPSDQDIQAVTSWLQSQGFQVNQVANGRTTIDFSGTAGTVQQAFHTAIHSYVLANGEQHWANSTDPQIPAALAPVVAGVNSLNNFRRKPFHASHGLVRRNLTTGKFSQVPGIKPEFTFAGASLGACRGISTSNNCWGVGPGDLSVIYNIPSTVNGSPAGTGQTIAIVSDSDIFATDVTAFRSIFKLAAGTFNQIETGTDPGVQGPTSASQDEEEAILDVEWVAAVAANATIDLVVSPTTNSAFGGDTSAQYVINCQTAGAGCTAGAVPASVLSDSYGACELQLGTTANQFYNSEWQQAAAEGITVVVASGDNGSAGCDDDLTNQPAGFGLQVNGTASTPYDVAVGGTDFNDLNNPVSGGYWSNSNTAGTLTSALKYIPETTYNDSCTNSIISTAVTGSSSISAETFCNSNSGSNFWAPAGGSGGASNCTAPTGPSPSNCAGGYAKPSWQVGTGVPSDGKRDIPDVSLFAGDGTIQNFYVVCEADTDFGNAPCSTTVPAAGNNAEGVQLDFLVEGGTSVSAQAFAGVVALIDQKLGGKQGNINPMLYALASGSSASSIFNDITVGTNAMPCVVITGTTGCSITGSSSNTIGILTGYNAGTGFDLATGLGSVNICSLINGSVASASSGSPTFTLTTSSCPSQVTISSPGASNTMTVTISSLNGFSGNVGNFSCSGLPTGGACSFSPSSVAITPSNSATVAVTITTTTASNIQLLNGPGEIGPWKFKTDFRLFGILCAVALAFCFGCRMRRWQATAVSVLILVVLAASCGGGSSTSTSSSGSNSTSATSTTANISASSGTTTQNLSFTVNIQ